MRRRPERHALLLGASILFGLSLAMLFLALRFLATDAQAVPPHGPYINVTSDCAACHRVHTGKNKNLLKALSPQSNTCFTCHDGTGAATNVLSQYAGVPQNNTAARLIYRHDALTATVHTRGSINEFGGVSNRHSECGDCHNPHKANATDSTSTISGVTASGRLAGVSGVSVVNGGVDTVPGYTFLPGGATPITQEYQLCFKCHSSFTTLPNNTGFPPSRFNLDKGVEFNPANPSYHPVEGPGKNTSANMALSLSGPSIYRRWTFTTGSVIRCSHCHASNTVPKPATTTTLGLGSQPLHGSGISGMLRAPYRNRLLKPVGEAFNAAEFELCFMCHSTAPFTATGGSTNWSKHYGHTNTRTGTNTGGQNIDDATANGGNAICAECHFRIHSTSFKFGAQIIPGRALFSVSPNVQPNRGSLQYSSSGPGSFNCAHICHGKSH